MPASPRILVVEDEHIVAAGLRKRLQQLGYEVPALAHSGEEAVRLAGELLPDLVLMDIQLEGEMDGVQAAAQVRGLGLAVVYLTAYSNREVLERAKVTEPYGYILKPYEDRELQVVVEMALYKHRTEQALRERERWLTAVLDSIGDAVVTTDGQGRITSLNPVAERLTGWSDGEARGKALEEVLTLIDWQTRRPVEVPLHRAMQERTRVPLMNHTVLVARGGEERPIDDAATPILNEGQPVGGVMVFRDVSERYRAEQEARAREKFLRQVIDLTPAFIVVKDRESRFVLANRALAEAYGTTPDGMLGKGDADFNPDPEEVAAFARADRQVIDTRTPLTIPEEKFTRCTGEVRCLHTTKVPLVRPDGGCSELLAVALDITQTKRLEQQYLQAQKMEAVGRLAGGVAHDFNNLLTVINGYSQVLLGLLHNHDRAVEMLEEIHRAGQRAGELTQQLLAYSRKQMIQPRVLHLNAVVQNARKMLARLIGEDVELTALLAPDLWRVKADPGQLDQVLMNLCVNARDAMPTGGKITVETRNVELDATSSADLFEIGPGRYVLLSVSDVGCGMDAETQAHLFEPFFTTKEKGKGTGLGLATVYGIVKQCGGHIRVFSEQGQGTTFNVYLPAVEEETPVGPSPLSEAPGGTETVLLVEDEEAVRGLACLLLRRLGYTVLAAGSGAEALAKVAQHPGRIDLLVTDVVMPGMSGRQVAEALRLQDPTLRILFVSGYTDDAVVQHGVLVSEAGFLQKPFTLNHFARKVRDVLDRRT